MSTLRLLADGAAEPVTAPSARAEREPDAELLDAYSRAVVADADSAAPSASSLKVDIKSLSAVKSSISRSIRSDVCAVPGRRSW